MSLSYPVGKSVTEVFTLLSDPDFIVARSTAIGELGATCEVEQQADSTVLYITRRIARHNVPRILTRVLNPVQTINFVEKWSPDGPDMVGHYAADVVGLPIAITAELRLKAKGDGCEYIIEHAARADIPLISGAIERFIISQTREGVGAEIDYLKQRLARSRST